MDCPSDQTGADVRDDHGHATSFRAGAIAALVAGGAGALLLGITSRGEGAGLVATGSF